MFKKRSRYTNQPCVRHGIKFDSETEADRYDELLLEQRAGVIRNLEGDKKKLRYKFLHDGVEFARYTPDFRYERREVVTDMFGRVELWKEVVEDHKGYQSAEDTAYKMRLRMMKVFYGIDVFESGIDRAKIRERKRKKRDRKKVEAKVVAIQTGVAPCPRACACKLACVYGATMPHRDHLCHLHFSQRLRRQQR